MKPYAFRIRARQQPKYPAIEPEVWPKGPEGASPATQREEMKQTNFPKGWNEERVRHVLEHYETQSDEEAVVEDEAAYESTTHTAMEIPVDLVPQVRELLAKRRAG